MTFLQAASEQLSIIKSVSRVSRPKLDLEIKLSSLTLHSIAKPHKKAAFLNKKKALDGQTFFPNSQQNLKTALSHLCAPTLAPLIFFTLVLLDRDLTYFELFQYKTEIHWFRGGYPEAFLAPNDTLWQYWHQAYIKTFIEKNQIFTLV